MMKRSFYLGYLMISVICAIGLIQIAGELIERAGAMVSGFGKWAFEALDFS